MTDIMAPVRWYRCVTMDEAGRVLDGGGFTDAVGTFLTNETRRGVWLTDDPSKLAISGAAISFDVVLAIDGLDEDELADFEWVYDMPNRYRERLVPAALLNERCTVSLADDHGFEAAVLPYGGES